MRYLPIFLDLRSGPILLVGGGDFVRAKLRLLIAAGARVRWYATDGDRDLGGLAVADGQIEHIEGDPLRADLAGVIAVFCAGAGDLGAPIAARARAHGLPVNVMDDLDHSSFIMPAIVDRGDVVVAVGTGGASPVVARRVREQIEALLPARIGDLAAFIGQWRKAFAARIPEFRVAPPILGARDRRPDRRAGFGRPIGRGGAGAARDPRPVTLRRDQRRRPRHAGGRGPRRSGSADGEGAARAAGCRRGVLRRIGLGRGAGPRPP